MCSGGSWLDLPNADVKGITEQRLRQWSKQFTLGQANQHLEDDR